MWWEQTAIWLKYWKFALITDLPNGKTLVVLYVPQAFCFASKSNMTQKMSEFWAK